jgi:hypothetical protein
MRSKRGAMELSMSTVVIVVLAMALLVGGLVLVRNILGGATESVDSINEKVLEQINGLYSENDRIVIRLGPKRVADVKADGDLFGFVAAAGTADGSSVTADNIKYKLSLDTSSSEGCVNVLGQEATEALFDDSFGVEHSFDNFDLGSIGTVLIKLTVPKGTELCSQEVHFDVFEAGANTGRRTFTVNIIRDSIF